MISNFGRIKSLDRTIIYKNGRVSHIKERILNPSNDKDGYNVIILCYNNNKKAYKIHRLVATHFIPNINNLKEINHKDENKQNNNVNNLEWCTRKYNVNYYVNKNKDRFNKQISSARKNIKLNKRIEFYKNGVYIKTFNSVKECSEELSIDRHRIADVILRGVKNRSGFVFKYANE